MTQAEKFEELGFYNCTTDADCADALGKLRARIKELQTAQSLFEDLLKSKGVEEVNGHQYRVTISYGIETARVNWKAVAAKLHPSHQLVAAHTNRSISDRVNVSALTKSA